MADPTETTTGADAVVPPAVDKASEKKAKREKKKAGGGPKPKTKMDPPPEYLAERVKLFDDLYAIQEAELAAKAEAESKPIKITLPDGKVVEGASWKTTPHEVALGISQSLANACVIAKVNDKSWDMTRVLEEDCTLKFLKFDDEDGKDTFWHSSAHILGQALELHYGGELCYGPEIEQGFYYDTFLGDKWGDVTVTQDSYAQLDELIKGIIKEKQPYKRLVIKKENLLKMFEYNRFKHRLITERIKDEETTVYRCGDLIDLCRGPHIRNTGVVKAMAVVKNSSSYWEGNAEAESLQRVYGISFPDKNKMKEWKIIQEEAAKRDHRKIGLQQELFFFHELSPGCCFFLPRGAFIYNTLVEFIREQYKIRGFQEVVTPNIFNAKLWETSGHWQHYSEHMFHFEVEKETYALKPMNCPSHCVMFQHRPRSHKELPMRLADFGVLHRNEESGSLSGLTRVRRFQQDDAHIFCTTDQIESEMAGCLDFLEYVYSKFGFSFELNLSTRPAKALGDMETWDMAEAALKKSLEAFGHPWKLNPGDGAFYGPKIDITIKDALHRPFQCATIQLDFQLPQRFELEYVPGEGPPQRPVMIHRAILGSVERMIAILTESFTGKWPFWINPRQVQVVPVHPELNDYAIEVRDKLRHLGYMVDANVNDSEVLKKKIRNAEVEHYKFIFCVGKAERDTNSVDVRASGGKNEGRRTLDEVIAHFNMLKTTQAKEAAFPPQEGAESAASSDAAPVASGADN